MYELPMCLRLVAVAVAGQYPLRRDKGIRYWFCKLQKGWRYATILLQYKLFWLLVIGRKHHLLSPERHLLFPEQGLFGVQRYCWTIGTETSPSQDDSCVAGIIPYATTEMEEACRWSRLTSPAVRHPIQLICSGLIGASFASAHCLAVFFLSASSLFTVALRASQFSQSNPQHAIKSFIFLNFLFMQN